MLRTIRRTAALAMIPAALALALAAPASATGNGDQEAIGTAWRYPSGTWGPTAELKDVGSTCTDLRSIDGARAAKNVKDSGRRIVFYLGWDCGVQYNWVNPGEHKTLGEVTAHSYRTVPV
ncbi:hypothetical protein ACWF94_13340 [Streptomyces sp. NPDC055078]